VTLEERIRHARRQLTDEEKARYGYSIATQKWTQEKVPTGELILKIKESDRYGTAKEWRETAELPLEGKPSDVIAEIAGMFETTRLRREREAEEQERRRKLEEERCLAEMERKREKIRYRRLVGDCENWRRAAEIRTFVAAVEASPLASKHAAGFAAWKGWALAHADGIDPLQDDDLFDQQVDDYEVYSLRE
jgi:beta-galactosidase/beta-glucuronidase